MNAYRVNIFHIADRDHIACTVPHNLVFNLFPSGNAPLHQNLTHTGQPEAISQNLDQLFFIVGNAAAASAQSISRAQNHRIANGIGKRDAVLNRLHHLGRRHRLPDLLHGFFKFQAILRLLDRLGRRTDKPHIVGL